MALVLGLARESLDLHHNSLLTVPSSISSRIPPQAPQYPFVSPQLSNLPCGFLYPGPSLLFPPMPFNPTALYFHKGKWLTKQFRNRL